jgi:hypothetical protein
MNRLSEYEDVEITLPPDVVFRDACFKCSVIAVTGATAALEPANRAEVMWLAPRIDGAFMTFHHHDALVALKGTLTHIGSIADLRFKVSDGVQLPRRKASRARVCLPVALRRSGSPEVVQGLTVDLSGDGVLVETMLHVATGDAVALTLSLPGSDEAVEAVTTVVRTAPGVIAVQLSHASRDARARLAEFVVERNRAALHLRQLELGDDF